VVLKKNTGHDQRRKNFPKNKALPHAYMMADNICKKNKRG
jgi:hypothetical protein